MASADGKDVGVTRAKALMALVLAVLWLPVTMHCALEGLPGLEFLICCDHGGEAAPHEDDDCEADACAVVESGLYKSQEHEDLVSVSGQWSVVSCTGEGDDTGLSWTSRPTDDVAIRWQFSSRATGFPRAPSFLL